LCIAQDCSKPGTSRKMCQMHYVRWKKHGSPGIVVGPGQKFKTTAHRFWRHVTVTPDCWQWDGGIGSSGYGTFHVDTKHTTMAHRMAYILSRGPIPDGLNIDHLCKNILCVNPWHLEPVTQKENLRRGLNGDKTHCLRGHPFDTANTYVSKKGHRTCRACLRIRALSRNLTA
jgi:hypothetical protein